MQSKYLTAVTSVFNPFLRASHARTPRIFLSFLPPNARSTIKITSKVLPQGSKEHGKLELLFTDGQKMDVDLRKLSIKDVIEEVNRHSRILARQDELSGN